MAIWPGWSVPDAHLSCDKWLRTDSRLGLLTQHAQHTRTPPVIETVSHLTTYDRTAVQGRTRPKGCPVSFSLFYLFLFWHNKSQRNQSETARRRKRTVITKVHEYGKLPGVHVALFIYHNGRYTTYRSINKRNWLLSMEEIVSSTPRDGKIKLVTL